MEKYISIEGSFIRRQYLPHLAMVSILCVVSGFFVSFRNLDSNQAAKVMEMYVVFAGIMLMTPLFMPEQNREIWLLEKSKAIQMWKLYLLRVLAAVVLIAVVVSVFEGVMYLGNSEFPVQKLWLGSFSQLLFVGSIGFFASGVTNQAVIGYMVSVLYYFISIGASKYLGKLALFQMTKGSYDFMAEMLLLSLVLVAGGMVIREKLNAV